MSGFTSSQGGVLLELLGNLLKVHRDILTTLEQARDYQPDRPVIGPELVAQERVTEAPQPPPEAFDPRIGAENVWDACRRMDYQLTMAHKVIDAAVGGLAGMQYPVVEWGLVLWKHSPRVDERGCSVPNCGEPDDLCPIYRLARLVLQAQGRPVEPTPPGPRPLGRED